MKNLFASIVKSLGLGAVPKPESPVVTIDPRSILFSLPTISAELPALEPVGNRRPTETDLSFHEDDWCQVEFFPGNKLPEIQRMLSDYKSFEAAHRVKSGWREIYSRKIARASMLAGAQPLQQLEQLLGVEAQGAPILFPSFSSETAGRVVGGFTMPLGGNVTLYGYTEKEGMPVLGASVGQNPDDMRLTKAFMTLNASRGLVLVDWLAQIVLTAVTSAAEVQLWRP